MTTKSRTNYAREWNIETHRALRRAALAGLGGKCVSCGIADIRVLQIDHVNGGGSKERKGVGPRTHLQRVLRSIANGERHYQLLCANCNWIKRHENREGHPLASYSL